MSTTPRTAPRKAAPAKTPTRPAPAKRPAAPAPKAAKTPKAAKSAAKAALKSATPPVPAPMPARKAPGEAKPAKKPKPVLVRDGFTMPEADFALIAQLKKRAAGAGRECKKSELLRAGLRLLARLEAASLVAALSELAPVKIGRPRKGH